MQRATKKTAYALLLTLSASLLFSCGGGTSTSGTSDTGVTYSDDFLTKYNIVGKGRNSPAIIEAEKLLARSPNDYAEYAKYRDRVLVSSNLLLDGVGVGGLAVYAPAAIIVDLDSASIGGAMWLVGLLVHERYHLDNPYAPHAEVFLYEASVLSKIGAPASLIAQVMEESVIYARAPLSARGKTQIGYYLHSNLVTRQQ